MAYFTITTDANWTDSAFSTRAGADSYSINGGTLTIDNDTRYGPYCTATTGCLGSVGISTGLGGKLIIDGTKVRLISYNTGTGNVPAIGTTITNSSGGITGYLLGVWSSLASAPKAAGTAMPASGYIKIKNATGSFTSGALTGIGATSTKADVAGWIEVVGVDGFAIDSPRLGSVIVNGNWFEAGTTTGSANQTIQLPASLTNTYYPGVWIETAVGSNTFEFYASAGTATTVFPTDVVRGKIVWVSAQGLLTIAKTSFGGYVPVSGLKVRVPNILMITCTDAAKTVNSYNVDPYARYAFYTSGGGSISLTKCVSAWYHNFVSPYSLNMSYCGLLDSFTTYWIGTPVSWDNVGLGLGTNINNSDHSINTCINGGTVSNCVIVRNQSNGPYYGLSVSGGLGFTFNNCKFISLVERVSTYSQGYRQEYGEQIAFNNCTFVGCNLELHSVSNLNITNLTYCDKVTGTTLPDNPVPAIFSYICNNVVVDGVNFGGVANVHPYDGVVSPYNTINITVKNCGTPSSFLNLGTVNPCQYFFGSAGGYSDGNKNIKIQRCYVTNCGAGLANLPRGTSNVLLETLWGKSTDIMPGSSQNTIFKGLNMAGAIPEYVGGVFGTHFFDTFVSTTSGKIGIFFHEPNASTSSYVTASLDSKSGFTSLGYVSMIFAGDTITYTWPHYILGYTSFAAVVPTLNGGNATTYFKYEYQINKNDGTGFSDWKNYYLSKTGVDTTNGNNIISMTSTTGISAGDRIYGSNITNGTYVVSVNNSTQCTLSANATGTGSGLTFVISALNGETGISPTNGFKFKIRITCLTSDIYNTISQLYCTGVTDATSQLALYPLNTVTATITVLDYLGNAIQNARVAVYKTSDGTELMNTVTNSSGIATGSIVYDADTQIDIRVRKSSTGTTRYINNDSIGVLTSLGFSTIITLIIDSIVSS